MPHKATPTTAPTFDSVWLLFQETREQMKETSLQMKETDKKFKETDKLLSERFQETDKLLSERFRETDKKIKELTNLFTTQWGKLVETLIEPSCLKLFKDRGIDIEQSLQNLKVNHNGEGMECDIVLVNSTELVVVEVKTTFKSEYATEFIEKLAKFKTIFPQYKNYKVLGAVAALKYEGGSDKFAYRQGLFVLRSTGEGLVKILNDKKFVPKGF